MKLPLSRTRWSDKWLSLWAERAGIMEFDGNLPRDVAEIRAEEDVRKLAAGEERQS